MTDGKPNGLIVRYTILGLLFIAALAAYMGERDILLAISGGLVGFLADKG